MSYDAVAGGRPLWKRRVRDPLGTGVALGIDGAPDGSLVYVTGLLNEDFVTTAFAGPDGWTRWAIHGLHPGSPGNAGYRNAMDHADVRYSGRCRVDVNAGHNGARCLSRHTVNRRSASMSENSSAEELPGECTCRHRPIAEASCVT